MTWLCTAPTIEIFIYTICSDRISKVGVEAVDNCDFGKVMDHIQKIVCGPASIAFGLADLLPAYLKLLRRNFSYPLPNYILNIFGKLA